MAMQRNYFTILFFIKKSKLLKNGEAPICMRITVNGQRAEIQIKRSGRCVKMHPFFLLRTKPRLSQAGALLLPKDFVSLGIRISL